MTRDDFEMLKEQTTNFESCYEELCENVDNNLDITHETTYTIINKLDELYDIYAALIHKVSTLIPDEFLLKPCPCCGGKAELVKIEAIEGFSPKYYVECTDCFIRTYESADKELTYESWNYRKSEEEK